MYRISILILLCIGMVAGMQVFALDFSFDEDDETVVYVNGTSTRRSYRNFLRLLEDYPEVTKLVLEDIPGSKDDDYNIKLCRLIYDARLTTELVYYSAVDSGGADLFACGYQLILHPDALIGVHTWSDGKVDGVDLPRSDREHVPYLELYNDVNIDEDFYWFTLAAAPADDVHHMTAEEIEKYFGHKIIAQ